MKAQEQIYLKFEDWYKSASFDESVTRTGVVRAIVPTFPRNGVEYELHADFRATGKHLNNIPVYEFIP